jgi:hypothetical protein
MNIEQELKKIFDKQAEAIYDEEMKGLKQDLENKNYAVYMEKCQKTLSEIEINSLCECYDNMEKKMKHRLVELDQIEEKLKSLSSCERFPSDDHIQQLNNLTAMSNHLTENFIQINSALESLENDYLDSIKKMKRTYENREKDSVIELLLKSYKEKKTRIVEMLKIKNEKERILFEKTETLRANSEKVAKCEAEYELTKEKYNQVFLSQQVILDEIQQMQQGYQRTESEIKYLETSLSERIINSSIQYSSLMNGRIFRSAFKKTEKRVFSLRLRENDPLRNLKKDITTLNLQYENYQMIISDHMSSISNNKSREKNYEKIMKDYKIFIGMIFYIKYLKIKIERVNNIK